MSWLDRLVQRSTPRASRAAYVPARHPVVDPADPELAGRAEEPTPSPDANAEDAAPDVHAEPSSVRMQLEPRASSLAPDRSGGLPRGVVIAPALPSRALPEGTRTRALPAPHPAPLAPVGPREPSRTPPDPSGRERARSDEERAPTNISPRAHARDVHDVQPVGKPRELARSELPPQHVAPTTPAPHHPPLLEPVRRPADVPPPAQALLPARPPRFEPAADAPALTIGRVVVEVGAPAVKVAAPPAQQPRKAASRAKPTRRAQSASSLRLGLGVR